MRPNTGVRALTLCRIQRQMTQCSIRGMRAIEMTQGSLTDTRVLADTDKDLSGYGSSGSLHIGKFAIKYMNFFIYNPPTARQTIDLHLQFQQFEHFSPPSSTDISVTEPWLVLGMFHDTLSNADTELVVLSTSLVGQYRVQSGGLYISCYPSAKFGGCTKSLHPTGYSYASLWGFLQTIQS